MDKATSPDRGGLWPVPYAAHERMIIRTQSKYDRRNIPRVWLWPILLPEDTPSASGPGGEAPHEVYWSSPLATRRYRPPVGVHLYADPSAEAKGRKKGTTNTEGLVQVGWSRAEARRVGVILATMDDDEFMLNDADEATQDAALEPLYVPRPGDIYRHGDTYYTILQMGPPDDLGPTTIPTVWKGTAAAIRDDSTNPGMPQLQEPDTPEPPRPAGAGPWRAGSH